MIDVILKNKKNILIMNSVIQIILSIYLLYKMIYDFEKMLISFEMNVVLISLTIILNLTIILILRLKDINKYKKTIITFLIIIVLFGSLSNVVLGLINIFILCKSTKSEINKEKVLDLPKIKNIKPNTFELIFGLCILVMFSTASLWIYNIPILKTLWLVVILYIVVFICSVAAFYKDLRKDFLYFIRNIKIYFKYTYPKVLLALLIYGILNALIYFINGQNISTNQDAITRIPVLLLFLMALFYAPFVEEVLYRGIIRRGVSNNKIFIVVSAIAFGLMHVLGLEHEEPLQYLYVISYSFMGGFLAYVYIKTNNIFVCIMCHFFVNLLPVIAIVLTRLTS